MSTSNKSTTTKSKPFSLTATRTRCHRSTFMNSGLRPTTTDLGDGTTMHCWVPKSPNPARPNVVLIHGFGANSLWQFASTVLVLSPLCNLYVPDLVFFGNSRTTRPDRSEHFQARCVKRAVEAHSVERMSLVGLSYGGFVAYSIAAQFKECVERVVVCCAGVCLEERDLAEGLFPVKDLEVAAELLLPRTVEKLRELLRYTFVKVPCGGFIPSFLLEDFIEEMCCECVEEKRELLRALAKDRKLSDLPKISQPTLIVWGDQDRIFPLELANRLKRHLGDNAELVVIKNTGHGLVHEKPREFHRHLNNFLSAPYNCKNSITNHK